MEGFTVPSLMWKVTSICGISLILVGWGGFGPGMSAEAQSASPSSKPQAATMSGGVSQDLEDKHPFAFALSPLGADFRTILRVFAAPQRDRLARLILADRSLMQGLQNWRTAPPANKLSLLKRIAALQAKAMPMDVPSLELAGDTGTFMMAQYVHKPNEPGTCYLYQAALESESAWVPLASLVHELRHAYQMHAISKLAQGKLKEWGPEYIFAFCCAKSWNAASPTGELGDELKLSFGNYVHLNHEFDAYQTGCYVATLVSNGTFDPIKPGIGYIDTWYDPDGHPMVDLDALETKVGHPGFAHALDELQRKAEQAHGIGN